MHATVRRGSRNRQLPEVLFKAVPEALVQSAPVAAFTISTANLGLLAAFGSLMVAVSPGNQACPAPPVILTYHPFTVLVEELLLRSANPESDPARLSGTLCQVLPSVVYTSCSFPSP